MNHSTLMFVTLVFLNSTGSAVSATNLVTSAPVASSDITIRTESYPRPPYSGASYYYYEKGDQIICTKLEVCNKFAECVIDYRKGQYKEKEDTKPFEKTPATIIPPKKTHKHRCLSKFDLLK